jgi:tetraacyldisaccharide 4'-kinase
MLTPAALVYRAGLGFRDVLYAAGLRRTGTLPCRVVSVGNLTVGGTGKTPLIELLACRLRDAGRRVVVLSRGYGGRRREDVAIVSDGVEIRLTAAVAGDEPVLLARRLPGVAVVVGRDRFRAGRVAIPLFAPDVILLDDGFQQRRLRKDVEVVCLDARAPFGPGGLLPIGSLREPVAGLARADLVVLTHADSAEITSKVTTELRRRVPRAAVAVAAHEVESIVELATGAIHPPETLRGRRSLAFAGIAAPADFRALLEQHGMVVADLVPFPDHHVYSRSDLRELASQAGATGAEMLITTEKDAVRLAGPPVQSLAGCMPIWVLRLRLRLVDDAGAWWRTLLAAIA